MLSNLILALRDLHPSDWRLATLLDEAHRRGWPTGVDDEWGTTWIEVRGVRGSVLPADDPRAADSGVEVTALSFSVDDGGFAEAVALLGPPPTIVDGPALRWFAPTARLEVTRRHGKVRVFVEPMPWSEDDENRSFEWGEFDGAPYRWRLDRDELLPNGLYLSGGIGTDDLDAVVDGLADLFGDLQGAAVELPDLVGSPTWIIKRASAPTHFVQGYFSATGSVTERWADGSNLETREHAPTSAGAADAAAEVRDAIEGWGVTSTDELTLEAFSSDTAYRFTLLALGLPS